MKTFPSGYNGDLGERAYAYFYINVLSTSTVTRARSSALSMVHGGEADIIETAKKQG